MLINCFCSNNFDMFQKVMEAPAHLFPLGSCLSKLFGLEWGPATPQSTLAYEKILEQCPLINPLIQVNPRQLHTATTSQNCERQCPSIAFFWPVLCPQVPALPSLRTSHDV